MDKIRRHHSGNIRTQIEHLEKANLRDDSKLKGLTAFVMLPTVAKNKKEELVSLMQKRKTEISELEKTEKDIQSGMLDTKLSDDSHRLQIIHENRIHALQAKKKANAEEKAMNLKKLFPNGRNRMYHKKPAYVQPTPVPTLVPTRVLDPDLVTFLNISQTFPDKMRRNILDMPNNKGYIYQGCWFLGKLPSEKNQPTIMFEKKANDILHIHEYTDRDYKLYEKNGKNGKELITVKKRIRKF